jgi:beta-galactosidase
MKMKLSIVLVSFLLSSALHAQRIQHLFDTSWSFFKGEVVNGERPDINDAAWRRVELPHDWSIEDLPNQSDSVIGPFSRKSPGRTATGFTVGGTGWYRKYFRVKNTTGKKVTVYFDGVYMNSDVWINGHHLGNHPYGYTPFYYDLTPFLKQNGENIIAVRVRNEGRNSRWYSGSGIYRHVWLITTNTVHIEPWGVFVTTPMISGNTARVNIKTTLSGEQSPTSLKLVTTIRDPKNRTVSTLESPVDNLNKETSQNITVNGASLWSPESPSMYQAISELKQGNQVLDRVVTNFGIRSIDITAAKGFLLNGKSIELRGGCLHHDNGALGAATIDRAEERRVELLKRYGFNAVRTAHNPPSQPFLDACDRLGIIVIDEAFDQWQRQKNPDDYHLYFDTCWKKDLDAMVLRDRNHPSVVFWSIGNEINERVDSSGLVIAKRLIAEVKRLDTTRPVTNALCSFYDHRGYKWDTTAPAFALTDVGSYNYMWREYESDHTKYPDRIMMGTESYAKEALKNWDLVEKHPYIIGDFVWTGMDHIGETGLGNSRIDSGNTRGGLLQPFPWFNSWSGDIDLIGGKKPQLYYRDIVWRTKAMHMLVHKHIPPGMKETVSDWGWPDELPYFHFPGSEGKSLRVNVYTRYPAVRLELNGKVIDQKSVSPDNLTATFEIAYQPGTLKAIALNNNGNALDSVILETPGKPAAIRLTADRKKITAGRNDLAYVTAEVIDAQGRLVSDAIIPLNFTITGNGEIAATASANPKDMQSFQKPEHRTFRGKCLVIVRPKGKGGKIVLKVKGPGFTGTELLLEANPTSMPSK